MQKIFILILTLFFVSASAKEINFSEKIGNFTYSFISKEISSRVYSSELLIKDGSNNEYYKSTFLENQNETDFKIQNLDKIDLINCSSQLSIQQLTLIKADLDKLIDKLISSLRLSGNDVLLAQLWFHRTIVLKKLRKLTFDKCECTIDPSYLVDKTNFLCMEDHFINRQTTINTIKNNPLPFNDSKGKLLLSFLENSSTEEVSFKDAYNIYYPISEYNTNVRKKSICLLGQGSAWGCCGNYSGCCYMNSGWCLVHDAICTNCRPRWFCFSGCVPD